MNPYDDDSTPRALDSRNPGGKARQGRKWQYLFIKMIGIFLHDTKISGQKGVETAGWFIYQTAVDHHRRGSSEIAYVFNI